MSKNSFAKQSKALQQQTDLTQFEKHRERYLAYIRTLMQTPRAGRVFEAGAISLRRHLEYFVAHQLKGERGDAFSMGQDDGLRWVLDEIVRYFNEPDLTGGQNDPSDPSPSGETV